MLVVGVVGDSGGVVSSVDVGSVVGGAEVGGVVVVV